MLNNDTLSGLNPGCWYPRVSYTSFATPSITVMNIPNLHNETTARNCSNTCTPTSTLVSLVILQEIQPHHLYPARLFSCFPSLYTTTAVERHRSIRVLCCHTTLSQSEIRTINSTRTETIISLQDGWEAICIPSRVIGIHCYSIFSRLV